MLKFALIWYGLASAVTFIAFVADKSRAVRGHRRIPERTLHTFEMAGGWPGAIAAITLARHKNRKWWFLAVTLGIAALHIMAWIIVLKR
ncbi:MAG: DUF1294 domain-containing protein [Phycisphaerales bacterium]|nr:DUF1294 domain-containing protein [Phycisphaerales bacterium]